MSICLLDFFSISYFTLHFEFKPKSSLMFHYSLGLRYHVTPGLLQLHWLPVRWRIQYKLCAVMPSINMAKCPIYLNDIVETVTSSSSRSGLRSSTTNEWKCLLAEIKNIKLNTNNNIKQCIHQRCYQVTNNIHGNPKSLNSS